MATETIEWWQVALAAALAAGYGVFTGSRWFSALHLRNAPAAASARTYLLGYGVLGAAFVAFLMDGGLTLGLFLLAWSLAMLLASRVLLARERHRAAPHPTEVLA